MFTAEETINLKNLGNGAAIEMFDVELQKVLQDLYDPNKLNDQERSITLTVKFKPGESQGIILTKVSCTSKLGGQKVFGTSLMIGREASGRVEAREMFVQRPLPLGDKIVPMERKGTDE